MKAPLTQRKNEATQQNNRDNTIYAYLTFIKAYIVAGALLCMLSVLIGAFAAHGLKTILTVYQLDIVQTGAKYQMYHGLAILIVSLIILTNIKVNIKLMLIANFAFLSGSILFSGSLYLLALTQITKVALLTPLGGLFFITGWSIFIWTIVKIKSSKVECE